MAQYEVAVLNGVVALPGGTARASIGIRDGRIATIGEHDDVADADEVSAV